MKKSARQKNNQIATLAEKAAAIAGALPGNGPMLQAPGLDTLVTNPLERSAATIVQRVQRGLLNPYGLVPVQKRFLFRAIVVPAVCRAIVAWEVQTYGKPQYWLWQHGTYIVASERMLLEMHHGKAVEFRRTEPLLSTLATAGLNYGFWLKRFDEWRLAAQASYQHFIKKQSPQIRKSAEPRSAHLGTLQHLLGRPLPPELFDGVMKAINANPAALKEFERTSKKIKPALWGEPSLDTWLLEIWPLVREYGWNYHDVWRVVNAKWNDTDAGPYDSAAKISDRCKRMLHLRLSAGGAARQGRPEEDVSDGPLFARLALWIRSIGDDEEEWIRGQLLTKTPCPKPLTGAV